MKASCNVWLASGLAVMCVGLGSGCAAEEPAGVTVPVFSPLSEPSRSQLRVLMGRFDGSGVEGLALEDVMDVIEGEGIRVFPYEDWTDDFVIQGFGFDLTTTLPETDYWGHQDPTGGYTFFDEKVYESNGDVASSGSVGQRSAYFSSGSVGAFSYQDTEAAMSPTSFRHATMASFILTSNATYNETAWNQQESSSRTNFGAPHSQEFAYQSHPTTAVTLKVGDRYAHHEITDTVIKGAKGWQETRAKGGDVRMTGTVTMFMPSNTNALANNDKKSNPDTDSDTSGGVTTTTYEETTINTSESNVGISQGVLETRRTVTTVETAEDRDANSGQVLSEDDEFHTTEHVTYSLRPGYGTQVLAKNDLERYADHTNTIRTLYTRTVTYKNAANTSPSKDEEITTVYRHTSNPATRHDITSWKSTRHRVVTTWEDDGDQTTKDHGTEWLVSEIIADPDYEAVPFAWVRKWSDTDDTSVVYFGDDASGHQTVTTNTVTEDLSGAWSDTITAAARGSHAIYTADVDNGDGSNKSGKANSQGVYTVTVNGQSATVSSEEWLDAIKGQ